jgi:photosystem II stability/assembly factor-like uncharacterized protein
MVVNRQLISLTNLMTRIWLILVYIIAGIFPATLAAGDWLTQRSGVSADLHAVHMLDKNSGWAVGNNGVALQTTNEGDSWHVRDTGVPTHLRDVFFLDALSGWIVGDDGLILRTQDGSTWQALVSGVSTTLRAVWFTSDITGFVVGDDFVILRTGDGGETWVPILTTPSTQFHSLYFSDASTGWIAGEHGVLLHTQDGGDNWEAQSSGTSSDIHAITFLDAQRGVFVGADGVIGSTGNGGESWTLQSSGVGQPLQGVGGHENGYWTVGGSDVSPGLLMISEDNAASWTVETISEAAIQDVKFIETGQGWAVGRLGLIMKNSGPVDIYPPVLTAGPIITNVGFDSAVVQWQTDELSDSRVAYGLTETPGDTVGFSDITRSHKVTLRALTDTTLYYYRILSTDTLGNTLEGPLSDFTTDKYVDVFPPEILAGPSVVDIRDTTAVFYVETDEPVTAEVQFRSDIQGELALEDTVFSSEKNLLLTGLLSQVEYTWSVILTDTLGYQTLSPINTFTTLDSIILRPVEWVQEPMPVDSAATAVTITWQTDRPATGVVSYGVDGFTHAVESTTLDTVQSITLPNLDPETVYQYQVVATSEYDVPLVDSVRTFTPMAIHNDAAPVLFAEWPVVQVATDTRALLSWRTIGLTRGNVVVKSVIGTIDRTIPILESQYRHQILISDLNPGIPYIYGILPAGERGQAGAAAGGVFTTLPAANEDAPLILGEPDVYPGVTSVVIQWRTAEPAKGQVDVPVGKSTATAEQHEAYGTTYRELISDLQPGQSYTMTIRSTSPAGLVTTRDVSFTTGFASYGGPNAVEPVRLETLTEGGGLVQGTYDRPVFARMLYAPADESGQKTQAQWSYVRDTTYTHTPTLPVWLPDGTDYITYELRLIDSDGAITEETGLLQVFDIATGEAPVILVRPSVRNVADGVVSIAWQTDLLSSSVILYTVEGEAESVRGESNAVRRHRVILGNLPPGEEVSYRVQSSTPTGAEVISDPRTFIVPGEEVIPAPVITGGPLVIEEDTSAVTIQWTTSTPSSSIVSYISTGDSASTIYRAQDLVTVHTARLLGLESSTQYWYDVISTDALEQTASSDSGQNWFKTPATENDVPPRIVAGPSLTDRRDGTAVVEWVTDVPADARVTAFTDTDSISNGSPELTRQHQVVVRGLNTDEQYRFLIVSTNRGGENTALLLNEDIPVTVTGEDPGPPVITIGPVVQVSGSWATIEWTTNRPTDGNVRYGENVNQMIGVNAGQNFTHTHSITLANLKPQTKYIYTVSSQDVSGRPTVDVPIELTFNTFTEQETEPAPVILQGPKADVSGTTATITWATDKPAGGIVHYREIDSGESFQLRTSVTLQNKQQVTLTDLDPGATYVYALESTAPGSAREVSPSEFAIYLATANPADIADSLLYGFVVSLNLDTLPPVVTGGPKVISRTDSSLTLKWQTDESAGTIVEYDTSQQFGNRLEISEQVTEHRYTLIGLEPATTYNIRVGGSDITGNGPAFSQVLTATTSDRADTEPPVLVDSVWVSDVDLEQVTIQWKTNEAADGHVIYSQDSTFSEGPYYLAEPPDSVFRRVFTKTAPEHEEEHLVILTNLLPLTKYYYKVESTDPDGNGPTVSSVQHFATVSNQDTDGPIITNLQVKARTDKTITLTWDTDELSDTFVRFVTDSAFLAEQGISKLAAAPKFHQTEGSLSPVTVHKITLTGLETEALYFLQVFSRDQFGNESDLAQVLQVWTLSGPDGNPPEIPVINAVVPGDEATFLSWNAVADSAGDLAGYNVYRVNEEGFNLIASLIPDTFYFDYGVPNDSVVVYSISAIDNVSGGNESFNSDTIAVVPTEDAVPDAPTAPDTLLHQVITTTLTPELIIENEMTGDSSATYTFVIAKDSMFTQIVEFARGIPQGEEVTSFQLTEELENMESFFWRARLEGEVFDGNWSETMTIQTDVEELGQPVNVEVEGLEQEIKLEWEAGPGSRNNIYIIYRSLDPRSIDLQISPILNIPDLDQVFRFHDSQVEYGVTYHYQIETTMISGEVHRSEILSIRTGQPEEFQLMQNFPNPFNSNTQIRFSLPGHSRVRLRIYNVLGQIVRTLLEEDLPGGAYAENWDGLNDAGLRVATGIYFYELQSGDFSKVRKMMLLR